MKNQLGRMEPNKWHPWVLRQDTVWIDRSGRVITVESIEGRYALNILKFVWREHSKDIPTHSPLAGKLRSIVSRDLHLYADEIKVLIEKQPTRWRPSYGYLGDEDYFDAMADMQLGD